MTFLQYSLGAFGIQYCFSVLRVSYILFETFRLVFEEICLSILTYEDDKFTGT